MADHEARGIGRRSMLAAVLGGAAAVIAGALGRPAETLGANGDAMKVGRLNTGSSATTVSVPGDPAVKCISNNHDGLWGQAKTAGRSGVYGFNSNSGGFGVYGRNTGTGSQGSLGGSAGVRGVASGTRLALDVAGNARFSRSGQATLNGSQNEIVFPCQGLTSKSYAMAVINTGDPSMRHTCWVTAAMCNDQTGTVSIYFNTPPLNGAVVQWLVLEQP